MSAVSSALEALKARVGDRHIEHDVATAAQAGRLAATLSVPHPAPETGDALPDGWYGIYFPPLTPTAELRDDGQPATGLLPPVPLPRRRLEAVTAVFEGPIRIGDRLTKVSEISAVEVEDCGTGPVVAIRVTERIEAEGRPAVREERGFRFFGEQGPGIPPEPVAVPARADWSREIVPDTVLLFRLSAVRFNTHRVHYDRDYATGVEGMPGLAVPVTLVSSQMLELLREAMPGRGLERFSYRAVQRMFDIGPYAVHGAVVGGAGGEEVRFWATDKDGAVCVLAEAALARP